jgi:hypothetical protein
LRLPQSQSVVYFDEERTLSSVVSMAALWQKSPDKSSLMPKAITYAQYNMR